MTRTRGAEVGMDLMTNLSAFAELVLEAAIHGAEVPHTSRSRRLSPNGLLPPVVCEAVGYTMQQRVGEGRGGHRPHQWKRCYAMTILGKRRSMRKASRTSILVGVERSVLRALWSGRLGQFGTRYSHERVLAAG